MAKAAKKPKRAKVIKATLTRDTKRGFGGNSPYYRLWRGLYYLHGFCPDQFQRLTGIKLRPGQSVPVEITIRVKETKR